MGEKIVTKEQRGPSFVRKIMYHKEMEKERFGIVRQPKEAGFVCNRLAAVYKRRLKAAGAKSR